MNQHFYLTDTVEPPVSRGCSTNIVVINQFFGLIVNGLPPFLRNFGTARWPKLIGKHFDCIYYVTNGASLTGFS